jgi:hypothetical protein
MFGEQGYQCVSIAIEESEWKAERIRDLFPESDVIESFPFPESP